jgi:hypothetical protein
VTSLESSTTRQAWQDLEVITLDSQGNPAKTVYYSYDQLLILPAVTVKTERDPNTNTPATYTGIYISDPFEAFGINDLKQQRCPCWRDAVDDLNLVGL